MESLLEGVKTSVLWAYQEHFLAMIFLWMVLVFNTGTDVKNYKIYNKSNVFLIFLRIGLHFVEFPLGLYNFLSAIAFFFILLIPAMYFMIPMGGDIKLVTAMAFYLGGNVMVLILGLSLFTSFMVSITLKYFKGKKGKKLPFAPFVLFSHSLVALFAFIM